MKLPTKTTLKKYGLTEQDYIDMYNEYDGACHVCLEKSKNATRALHIEHQHVKGWKQMPPEQRRLYVRGLACFICNFRILTKGVTLKRLRNAVKYLERYENSK